MEEEKSEKVSLFSFYIDNKLKNEIDCKKIF